MQEYVCMRYYHKKIRIASQWYGIFVSSPVKSSNHCWNFLYKCSSLCHVKLKLIPTVIMTSLRRMLTHACKVVIGQTLPLNCTYLQVLFSSLIYQTGKCQFIYFFGYFIYYVPSHLCIKHDYTPWIFTTGFFRQVMVTTYLQ